MVLFLTINRWVERISEHTLEYRVREYHPDKKKILIITGRISSIQGSISFLRGRQNKHFRRKIQNRSLDLIELLPVDARVDLGAPSQDFNSSSSNHQSLVELWTSEHHFRALVEVELSSKKTSKAENLIAHFPLAVIVQNLIVESVGSKSCAAPLTPQTSRPFWENQFSRLYGENSVLNIRHNYRSSSYP